MKYYYLLQTFIVGMVLEVALQFAVGFVPQEVALTGISIYMTLGVLTDCFSSLILDPIYRFSGLLNYDSYSRYVEKSKDDPTIQDLSAQRIFYRNLTTAFMVVFLLSQKFEARVILGALIFMSLLRMRKFHVYVLKRIR